MVFIHTPGGGRTFAKVSLTVISDPAGALRSVESNADDHSDVSVAERGAGARLGSAVIEPTM